MDSRTAPEPTMSAVPNDVAQVFLFLGRHVVLGDEGCVGIGVALIRESNISNGVNRADDPPSCWRNSLQRSHLDRY